MAGMKDDDPRNASYALSDRPAIEGRGPGSQDTIDSKELVMLTGATYRQIDYWCRQGIIFPVGEGTPGSGNRRQFDKSLIDRIKLVVKISAAFSRDNSPMKYILEHYEDGEFNMGDGVYLTWDVIEIERDTK